MKVLPVLLLVSACHLPDYSNADLQLDISDRLPPAATQVRICVEGSGERTQGAGGERYAMPGLPAGSPAMTTVDVLLGSADTGAADDFSDSAVLARAGPVTLGASSTYLVVALEHFSEDTGIQSGEGLQCSDCPEPCSAESTTRTTQEDSWLLAVRFAE